MIYLIVQLIKKSGVANLYDLKGSPASLFPMAASEYGVDDINGFVIVIHRITSRGYSDSILIAR